jgi:hypothetical protein
VKDLRVESRWGLEPRRQSPPFACLLALAVLAPLGRGGDERILGSRDLEFARALVRSGYPDLADELLTTIESGKTRSKDDSLFAQALRLELNEYAAYQLSDPQQQSQALEKVVADMEKFVQEHPGTIAADGLNDRLLDLYRGYGERVAALLANPDTAAEAKNLRGTGEKMFDRAIETLKTEREEIQKKRDQLDVPDEELERRYMLTEYNLARAYYFHAQILDDEFQKNTRLKNALGVLGDIQLDFPNELLCFEGYIYEGLAQRDLGDPKEAIVAFDYAIGLRDTYERGVNGLYMISPDAADIVSAAVLQKMILQLQQNDTAAAIETAKDFYATIPEAARTLKGLAILSQQAEAHLKAGDSKGVEAVAQRLIELDPHGSGGERGRELLGASASGSLGGVDTYRLADSAARRGDVERAVALCQQTMVLARGTAEEPKLGAQACLLLGALEAQRGHLHEAVVAWSSVTQRYSKGGDEAPECLWRAANGYLALLAQEKSAFYKDGAREMMSQLTARYPNHRYASMAAIIEGQQLEAEEQFDKAAEVYLRIPDGSAGHEESLYRAGNAWIRQMAKLKDAKSGDAKAAATKAEELLKKARTTLEKAASETLDLAAQERLRALAFNSRVSLANLYLTKGVDRAADVAPLFEGAEREFSGDVAKLSPVRALRLKALLALGRIDEAALLFDQQLKDDPSGKGLGASAAVLARAYDEKGVALKPTNSVESEAKLRKAATYYGIAIRGQVSGEQAVQLEQLELIANRLYALALQFNGVPDTVVSFVEWKGTKLDDSLLDLAVRAFDAVLTVTPSYRVQIVQARALGFLQRWEDAAEGYARLFERESFANLSSRTIDTQAMQDKPELGFALLEWGVGEREIGAAKNAPERLARASSIFETLVVGTRADTKLWWPAKFYQVQTLSDRGEYETAKIIMRDMERNYPEFDKGPLKERFQRLAEELKRK